MKHNKYCTKWAESHPYDCPECKVLEDLEYRLETKHGYDMDRECQEQYDYGFEDGIQRCESGHDELLEKEFDKGHEAGYAECMKIHNLGD